MFDKSNVQDIYYLSPMQEGMLYHTITEESSTMYVTQYRMTLRGNVDIPLLEESFNLLIGRHDILRTCFIYEKVQRPRQVVFKKRPMTIYSQDISQLDKEEKTAYVQKFQQEDREKGFDLLRDVLMRISILKIEDNKYEMIWSHHHILMDGWCNSIIMSELLYYYDCLKNKKPIELKKVYPYSSYIQWLQEQDIKEARACWKEYLKGYNSNTLLAPQNKKMSIETQGSKEMQEFIYQIDENLTDELKLIAKKNHTTVNNVFQTIWGILLLCYNQEDDVIFGTVVSGRPSEIPGIEDMVGLFINSIPVRILINHKQTFSELLKSVKLSAIDLERYHFTPLVDIQSSVKGISKLFDHIITFQNFSSAEVNEELGDISNVGFEVVSMDGIEESNYDLALIVESDNVLAIKFIFNTQVYPADFIERISRQLRYIVKQIIANPEQLIFNIKLVNEEKQKKILSDFNNTKTSYPRNKSLVELFEEQVQKKPDQVALVFKNQKMTYRTLNERANQLARTLRDQGVVSGEVVGIMANRSFEMVIGVLAVLKAGAAYLPIDPNYPVARKQYMLEDSGANFLLIQKELDEEIVFEGTVLELEDETLYGQGTANESIGNYSNSEDIASIIYTSGSTGQPKGNMTAHYNISRIVKDTNYIRISEQDCLTQIASFSFDASIFEIFGALLNGAQLVLIEKEDVLDAQRLFHIIETEGVTIFFATTALFNTLVDMGINRMKHLRKILFGGEKVSVSHVRKALQAVGSDRLIHLYGPSESTVFTTFYPVNELTEDAITVPIGVPISNTKVYVLDHKQRLCPIGVPGELYVGGDGLVKGYINKPELTMGKFIENPFVPGERVYRTGDMVRWLPDGNIDYIGRIDKQIKIRGHRIEPGEIMSHLLNHEAIQEAAVVPLQDSQGDAYLCAYYVPVEGIEEEEYTESSLRAYLSTRLPDYMMPSAFCQLEKLPLTVNGKLDAAALPEPDRNMYVTKEYVLPQNETERKLSVIWQEVLGIEEVGRFDHFFECGGHSLKAMLLVSRIAREFEVTFQIKDVFHAPVLYQMAETIEQMNPEVYLRIEPVESRGFYPVSSAQQRIHVASQLTTESVHYNVPLVFEIEGDLQKERLVKAFEMLIKRHEALRTSFHMKENTLVQCIHNQVEFSLEEIEGIEENVPKLLQEFVRPFDLTKPLLMRAGLLEVDTKKRLLLVDLHHIITDGMSTNILLQELVQLYQKPSDLEPLRIQYKDYAVWQQKFLQTEGMKRQEAFWLEKLEGELPILELPTDFPRPSVQQFEGAYVDVRVNRETTEKLQALTKEENGTLYMTLLAAYNVLLARYTGQEDFIVGTPIAGRPHEDLEPIIGMFVNTLAIHNKLVNDKPFREFLQEVRENVLKSYEHQMYPLEDLIGKLKVQRDMSRNPLFDTIFTLQNVDLTVPQGEGFMLCPYPFDYQMSKVDVTVGAVEEEGELHLRFEYSTALFTRETIEQMSTHFCTILQKIANHPDVVIANIDVTTEEEKERLIVQYNKTETAYPKNKSLAELFEEQVQKYPDQVALVYGEQSMTYRELDRKANGLAHRLQAKGVKADTLVGLLGEHSLETLVSMVAILKAGGAYLPIDPNYPLERKQYMMQDSGLDLVVATENYDWDETILGGEVIQLSSINELEGREDSPIVLSHPKDLAYVLYTSGSTGQPKGVMVEQRNVVRLIKNTNFTDLSQGRLLLTGAIVFDASTFEIWGALLNGLTLSLIEKDTLLNPFKLQKIIERQKITTMWLTAPLFNQISQQHLEVFENLTSLIVGGDVLSPYHINAVRERYPNLKLINGYGPTENTTFSTTFLIEDTYEASIPIGRPIANSTAYVLNPYRQLCPVGIPGELYVGGAGVARGYLNKQELTMEKFIDNPFVPGEKLYRTGDMVRWLPDGNIEYIGRIDKQIKIRGHRIEPGEIVSHLLNHKAIQEAAVVPLQDSQGDVYLCAYYVPIEGIEEEEYTETSLRLYLSTRLPDYMMPSAFCQLEKLTLTVNGKLDVAALPEPDRNMYVTKEYVPPQNETERKLSVIWQEVLGIEEVGRFDHFFECGGHSLKAMLLVSRIAREFEVTFQIKDVFHSPVLYQMAETIEQMNPEVYLRIEPVESRDFYPVSSAQQRIHVASQLATESVHYNVPLVFEIEGDLQKERLVKAFEMLIKRHEALRTSFHMKENTLVQCIHNQVEFSLEEIEGIEENVPKLLQEFVRPFDLTKPLLMRAGLLEVDTKKRLLLVDLHHIITDGMSTNILLQELVQLYQKPSDLEPLRIQYKDYAVWQQKFLQTEGMKRQEAFWLEKLEGELPILELPTDFPRPSVQQFEGAYVDVRVNRETTEKLQALTKEENGTLYMTLLAAYNVLLARYTGQEDFIVGTPIAGRPHEDLEPIIGMFVNTLAIRNKLVNDKPFREFLQEVRENVLKSYEHQMYPLEDLIGKLKVQRDMSRNPLFDTIFTLQNVDLTVPQGEGFMLCPYPFDYQMSKVDVTVGAVEEEGELHLRFEYSTALFTRETIEQMSTHFCTILQKIANHPDVVIANIDVTTEEEKERLIVQYNKTETAYPKNKSLAELFEEQVQKYPDQVALVYGEQSMTYRELDRKANGLAHRLQAKGVKADTLVGLLGEHSLETLVSMVAILKAGGAYLPIDPNYPLERKQYMMQDSGLDLVVATENYDWDETILGGEVIQLSSINELEGREDSPIVLSHPKDLAYVLYTSGSTGQPKGVMVEQRNVVRLIKNTNFTDLSQGRLLLTGAIVFDASTFEIWGALLNGLTLSLIEKDTLLNPFKLQKIIERQKITTMWLTAPLFNQISQQHLEVFENLTSLIVGGDVLSPYHINVVRERYPNLKLINGYGPTENTTFSTTFLIEDTYEASIPIGRPIANSTAYVLNPYQQLCPVGIPGELYVGGAGVARGYLNKPELTTEKFIDNPFVPGERLYRTGDMVRWLVDGNIEYIGRIDKQIKIRGHRIEPGEIVSHLLNHEAIQEAAVVPLQDSQGDAYLCAYYVPVEGVEEEEYTESSLRSYLSTRLPDYMMPSAFCQLEKLPLTVNGKVDKIALPKVNWRNTIKNKYQAPVTLVEKKLVSIWESVLDISPIGVLDNFFEHGGHSLKAMRLVSHIHEEFQVQIPLRDVFQRPILNDMARYIEKLEGIKFIPIEKAKEQIFYPTSLTQQHMYEVGQNSIAFNMPMSFLVEGPLNVKRVKQAVEKLIERHDVLRTTLEVVEGNLVQRIHDNVDIQFVYKEGKEQDIKRIQNIMDDFIKLFNFNLPPLLRVQLIKISVERHILMFDIHHSILDGTSLSIFTNEFAALYEEKELPPLHVQYKDYIVWKEQLMQTEEMKAQEAHWLQQFSGELPVLKLPYDFSRPKLRRYEGDVIAFEIDKQMTAGLYQLGQEKQVTLYMTLMTCFHMLLHQYSGQEDIVIGSPIQARPHVDLENVLGLFINEIAIRNQPKASKSFLSFLEEVKETILCAYENQNYPFEELVLKLQADNDKSRSPIFIVSFAMQNMQEASLPVNDLQFQFISTEFMVTEYDISLYASEVEGRVHFEMSYSTHLFRRETMERFVQDYVSIVRQVLANPMSSLGDIKLNLLQL